MTDHVRGLTPPDDAYATCERTVAKLLIYSEQIRPEEISDRLSLQPTAMYRQGQQTTNSLGRTRTAKANMWFLSSEDFVTSRDARRHLDWLLDQLAPRREALLDLQRTSDTRMTVECIWWSKGDGGPTLWPEQMRRLADLNLELGFQVSFYGEEPEA